MKLFAKRALILTIFVLCLFGLTVLAASAAGTEYASDVAAVEAGAVARIGDEGGAGYYTDLATAISEAASGDTIYVLKNTALSATDITDKAISIVGSAKHTVTVASGGAYAIKLLGTNASLTLSNLVLDVSQTGKNTNAYVFGVSKSTAGTFTLTLDNVDTKWKSGSGAIYGYGSVKADISITNCSFSGGTAIINTAAEATNVTMYLQNVGCVGSVGEVNSGATSRVTVTRPAAANYASDAEAIAAGIGFRLGDGEGGATGEKYFWSLGDAITAAQGGDTVYVLANAVFAGGAKFGGKALTIQGANADVVLTHIGGGLQLNGGDVSLTIKDLTINSYANFLDIYTSTDTHSVKLENVTVNSAAAANANFIYVSNTKANIEIVDCTFNSTNSIRAIYASSSANVTSLKITNSDFTNVYVARVENAGVIGSAETPAELTDLTSNKVLLYAYTGTIYADIFGGEFTGPLVYGGDNHNNYLGIRFNPTGEKTTTFTFAASSKYGAFVYQNPADSTKNSMSFSFRNTNITDSGKYAILNGTLTKANITVTIENSAFGASALAANGSQKYYFGSDADAKAFGYTVRIGAEGTTADYYKTLTDALNAAPADDGSGGQTMVYLLADTTQALMGAEGNPDKKFGKKVHITSKGKTPFTVEASSFAFYFTEGAEVTFTNITYELKSRFARIDGPCTVIFGEGCTMNTADAIFIWDNGNSIQSGYDTEDKVLFSNYAYTIEVQDGAFINSTGALSKGLIYKDDTNPANITIKIAGDISVSAAKPIIYDEDAKSTYTIYYDATTANVSNGGGLWFSNILRQIDAGGYSTRLFAKGFENTEKGATWGYSIGASAMTYSADPSQEWNYMFVNHGSMTYSQWEGYLNSYGGEMWQLKSTGNIWWTHNLNNFGTVTMKSYNGAYITGPDASYRIQLTGTTLILDGITIYGKPATIQFNAGTAATPSALKLINGAKIICNTADSLSKLIKVNGAYAVLSIDETSNIAQSGAESTRITEEQLIAWGFTMREDSLNSYHNRLETAMAAVPDGGTGTIYFLAKVTITTFTVDNKHITFIGRDSVVNNITYTDHTNADLYVNGDSGYVIQMKNRATLTFKNMAVLANRPMFQTLAVDRNDIAAADQNITLNFINSWASGGNISSVFMSLGGAYNAITVNVDADSKLLFGPVSSSVSSMFNVATGTSTKVTLNVDGTLDVMDRYTTTPRRVRIIYAPATVPITLNVSETASILFTCTEAQAVVDHSIVETASGANVTATIAAAAITGENGASTLGDMYLYYASNTGVPQLCITASDTTLESTLIALKAKVGSELTPLDVRTLIDATHYYYNSLANAVNAIPDGGTATLQFLAQVVSANITVANKHLTFIGKDNIVNDLAVSSSANADLYFSGTSGYVITLQDKATLTFRNMAVYAGRPLFIYTSTARTDLTQEESDITLNFENSWVSGGYASSVFMGGNAGSRVCDTFTINVDATSKLMFAPGVSSDSEATMFYANYACFPNFVVNLHGTFEIEDKCTSTARRIWVFDVNAANTLTFNAFETAKIKFTCNEAQAAADHALFDAGKVRATIAAAAITDENGNSTLGDLYLYVADSNNVPNVCITHPTTALESTLIALKAKVGSELTPIALREQTTEGYNYYNTLVAAVDRVATGGEGTFYVIQTMPVSATTVLTNRNITLVGADLAGAYHLDSTASYAFTIDNLATLTFRDMKVTATAGLVLYRGVASGIAQADRDIYVNFENTTVDADGAATSLISSNAHHGDTSSTAANQKKQCDSVTVTIDEDSEINFTTSATGEVKVIRYDHNTHAKVYTFIYGDITVNATGDADTYFYLVRSNNPSTTQITVGEKANISITLAATRRTNGKSFFTSCTGGNANSNKLVLHASAITENGNLTLSGVKAYSGYTSSCIFDVLIIANDTSDEAVLLAWEALDGHEDTDAGTDTRRTYAVVKYRAMADGVYYYTNVLNTAVAKLDGMESTGSLYLWADASISTGMVLDGVTFNLAGAEGVTLTSSAANLFTVTNGAGLTVDGIAINSTATTTTVAGAGTFLRADDAEVTAKSTASFNNVTLTASGLPFYFGGASVVDVTIAGGAYTASGMFSFGIASGDLDNSGVDVFFDGVVNLTVTGTAEKHVTFQKSGSGDTRSLVFVNSSKSVKDNLKVTFDYVDTAVTASHNIYLRNKGTLTMNYSNGTMNAANWAIGSQGSATPYLTFTNVAITGTSTDHIMRPYSGTAGAYIKFIGGSITANNVKGDNPILNFNSKMDVTFDGVTFNSTSAKALIGGSATSYTLDGCTFNLTSALLNSTSLTVILRNATINSVAVTDANSVTHGFNLKVAMGQDTYYATTLNNIVLGVIPDGGTATVQILAQAKSANIIINNKTITFVGKDSTVNDLTATSSTNADLYFNSTSGYVITLQDKATVTFRNIAVYADRPLFMYYATGRTDLDKADLDITVNLVNAWLSGGSASSVFMGTDTTHSKCDDFTVNVDATSKMLFAPSSSSDSTMFFANYSSSFTVNLNGAIEVTDRCTSTARPIWMFNTDTAVPLTFNVSETASIKFSCTEAQAAANHTIVDQSASAEITIAAAAITDENGKSTLGDMYLYLTTTATVIPKIRITHTSNALETTLRALTANVASVEETPIQYLVVTGGVYNYFNSLDAATAFAQTNGGTVQNLKQGVYADVAAAVAGGMIYRYGDAVVNGSYGVHYFDQLAALVEYAKSQGATEIAVYVLTSGKGDSSTVTLTGVKLTLDSVDSTKQSVKMSGYPVFELGENAHLVVKNVKILINSGFVDVVAKGETNTAKLDLETNAEIEAPNFTGGYFLYSESTALLTVNLKQGSSIKMQTNGTKTSARQGMFDFTSSGNIVAEGSSITVDGTLIYALTFDGEKNADARRAAMFKMGDKTLDLFFTEHADVQLLHVNAYAGTWNNIVCLDITSGDTVVSFNGGKYTTTENCGLIGLNGAGFNGTYTVTGNIDVSGVSDALVYDYATDTADNTTVILFKDVNLGSAKVARNNRLVYVQLENVAFVSDAHAAENYGVKVQGFDNYYSLNKAVDLAADGGTITLLGNVIGAGATITNKTLTIQGADSANPILITNSSNGSAYIFKCIGNAHLTLKNLQINAKARAVSFDRGSHTEIVDGKEKTVYDDVTSSSLSLINTDIYGVAAGSSHNAMIYVGGGSGHHNFDLHIDATSSVGYVDGTPAEIESTRNYQVIFYNTSVTGDIVIEGEVYAYVYFQNDKVNYDLVRSSWTAYGPNAQYMISIGNSSAHTFIGNVVVTETATLTHKVVFPDKDENGKDVYYEDYPYLHSAYAIRVFGANAAVIEVDGAAITTEYTDAHPSYSGRIRFDGVGDAMDIKYEGKEATLHYFGVGALLATLNKTDYADNKITIATANGSNFNIIYDGSTYISDGIPDDAEATDIEASDAAGYDFLGAMDIAELLNKLTGRSDISAVKDSTTATKEIIVGIANRDVVQTYLHQLEMNEFAIVFAGDKILVLAWHDAALAQAIESFKSALVLCADGSTVTLPNVPIGTVYKFVANREWRDDFTKPADGTLWGGQYVDSNSLQYVYNGYDDTRAGHQAYMAYCAVLEREGYTVVWQNVIGNNLFRLYTNNQKGISLYVAYNDYEFKSTFYGTDGENGLYGQEENDKTEIEPESILSSQPDLDDEYFENRDHQKVLRVVSMPHTSVALPDEGINAPDFTYNKVTNTLQTTLSFQGKAVGLGHVYMLEDGRFLVIDGGGVGFTSAGDPTESEAIYNVMVEMYTNVYGHAPTVEQPLHIAAWYLTHTHWDHYSAFNAFASTYGQDKKDKNDVIVRPGIKLDYVIANVPVQESVYKNAEVQFSAADINNLILKFKGGNAKYMKVCTGQKLYLANLEIEVLMTFMDHAPFDIVNTNDTNTVTRFTIYNKLSNDDTLHTQSAQVLYLGDSWRHSSRILCEMYGGDEDCTGNYLQSDIVQLAHHGNIGCERILYKRIMPTAVYFSHDAASFKSYVYFDNFTAANASETVCFRYAANVWCAYNAEYMWSAPYGTYNTLEFQAARPDYEGVKDLFTDTLLTSGNQYDINYTRTNSTKYSYIHNTSKATTSVNVVWGDLSFSYDDGQGSLGTWNPATHEYEGATPGTGEAGWKPNGDNRIVVSNASTQDTNVNVELKFTAASEYTNFTGAFSDNGTATIASKDYKVFTFTLGTTALPTKDITDQVIGNITVTLS